MSEFITRLHLSDEFGSSTNLENGQGISSAGLFRRDFLKKTGKTAIAVVGLGAVGSLLSGCEIGDVGAAAFSVRADLLPAEVKIKYDKLAMEIKNGKTVLGMAKEYQSGIDGQIKNNILLKMNSEARTHIKNEQSDLVFARIAQKTLPLEAVGKYGKKMVFADLDNLNRFAVQVDGWTYINRNHNHGSSSSPFFSDAVLFTMLHEQGHGITDLLTQYVLSNPSMLTEYFGIDSIPSQHILEARFAAEGNADYEVVRIFGLKSCISLLKVMVSANILSHNEANFRKKVVECMQLETLSQTRFAKK